MLGGVLAVSEHQKVRLHRTEKVSRLFHFAFHSSVQGCPKKINDVFPGKGKTSFFFSLKYVLHSSRCHLFALFLVLNLILYECVHGRNI